MNAVLTYVIKGWYNKLEEINIVARWKKKIRCITWPKLDQLSRGRSLCFAGLYFELFSKYETINRDIQCA